MPCTGVQDGEYSHLGKGVYMDLTKTYKQPRSSVRQIICDKDICLFYCIVDKSFHVLFFILLTTIDHIVYVIKYIVFGSTEHETAIQLRVAVYSESFFSLCLSNSPGLRVC